MEKYTDEVPLLVAQAGPLNGQRWALRKTVILGREPGCDIVIADRLVSRHHARITPGPRGILLEDLGSKNGTHHNGKPIQDSALLADGDVIQIALAQQFVFLSSDSTVPLENQPADLLDMQATGLQMMPTSASSGKLHLEKRSRQVWIRVSAANEPAKEHEILPPFRSPNSGCSKFYMITRVGWSPDPTWLWQFGAKVRHSIFPSKRLTRWCAGYATGLPASIRRMNIS